MLTQLSSLGGKAVSTMRTCVRKVERPYEPLMGMETLIPNLPAGRGQYVVFRGI